MAAGRAVERATAEKGREAACRAGLHGAPESEVAGVPLRRESLVALPSPFALARRVQGAAGWSARAAADMLDHVHWLDLRAGVGSRDTRPRDGRVLRIREERLVSMAAPRLAAQRVTPVPDGWSGRPELRAGTGGAIRLGNATRPAPYAGDHLAGHRPGGAGGSSGSTWR